MDMNIMKYTLTKVTVAGQMHCLSRQKKKYNAAYVKCSSRKFTLFP